MKITSTQDVSLPSLQAAADSSLPASWKVDVDDSQVFLRAYEAPSWVSIAASAPWWVQMLGTAASVYIAGILSEAGKDTWKNRGRLAAFVKQANSAVVHIATFAIQTRIAGNERTFVRLEVPLENGFDSVGLKLEYQTQDELEFEIALFVHYAPQIESLLQQTRVQGNRTVGGVNAEFGKNDYSMLLTWLDRESLERKDVVFELLGDV